MCSMLSLVSLCQSVQQLEGGPAACAPSLVHAVQVETPAVFRPAG
jgi:hypothetical protein